MVTRTNPRRRRLDKAIRLYRNSVPQRGQSVQNLRSPGYLAVKGEETVRLKSRFYCPICTYGPMSSAPTTRRAARICRAMLPSLPDVLFGVLLLALCARPAGFEALLADGDTGWHIRTGQLILQTGRVPAVDVFSFSKAGEPWFAWEWLSDVFFAIAFHWRGIACVAALAAAVLCGAATLLFTWLLRRGSGIWIAAAVTLAVFSASSIHYLARPHVFSILLYTVSLRILDKDGLSSGRRAWWLIPLTAVWANLHAGFVAVFLPLALLAAIALAQRHFPEARRYGWLTLLTLAASLCNPYGWRLDWHIARYLNAPWILDHVQEFQSPNVRSEGMVVFALLLLAGAGLASRALGRGQWFEGGLVLVWGFAALRSARHIPFYAISAAPLLASELALAWGRLAAGSSAKGACRLFWHAGQELGHSRRVTLWLPLAALAILAVAPAQAGFPETRFPVRAVERAEKWLAPWHGTGRLLTSDQWADYVIFRLYPRQLVFFDGRSDFYGPALGSDYRALMVAAPDWRELLDRYSFQAALLPRDWPLSTVLGREPGWRQIYEDSVAVLCVRETGGALP